MKKEATITIPPRKRSSSTGCCKCKRDVRLVLYAGDGAGEKGVQMNRENNLKNEWWRQDEQTFENRTIH
ncbi:hypothetical protein O3P69_000809 [Scylla paramamosain]|uniref:Uncharacterized protein n=1 Tax=Scylla paramamosain TaxID=85552 RepID=A0AAW0UVL9_SCYPA